MNITFSIVSHGHGTLVSALLADLERMARDDIEVILTRNVLEEGEGERRFDVPVREVVNCRPRGFGANHNTAFSLSHGEIFVVLNPDVRLRDDPCDALIAALAERSAVVAPAIVDESGAPENSARRFPSVTDIARKALAVYAGLPVAPDERPATSTSPDWVAGMFMAFPRALYERLNGFDERYFMYYEDVDICARARRGGATVELLREIRVEHDARRDSRRRASFLRRHVASALRYYGSDVHRWAMSRRR